jgi:putative RecB family exonuclease
MAVYSFSQIQTYLQCPLKYKFRYVDNIKPEFEENLHLILWTEVHAALEWLYNEVNNFKKPSYEQLEQVFLEKFNEKASKLNEEQEKIDEFLTRWKYYLKSFYDKHFPFEDIKVIWTEIQLYIDLDDSIKFQGFIDRLDKKGDDFILTDYKTNKNLPPEDKTLYEEQLTLYALGVKQKYWKYFNKIYGNLVYLHFDIQDFWEITDEKIKSVQEKYKNLALEIETKKAEYNLWNKEAFPEKENPNCKFCDYKELCPLFAHFYWKVDDYELGEDIIKSLIDEYVKLNKQKKELEKQMEQDKEILLKFAKRNNLKKIYGNKEKLSVVTYKWIKILDKEKLKEKLEKLGILDETLEVDRFKLKKLLDSGKLKNTDLQDLIDFTETLSLR